MLTEAKTLWDRQPASLYTKNLKESLEGGLVSWECGRGWPDPSPPLLCCSRCVFTYISPRLVKSCTFVSYKDWDRWAVAKISNAFLKARNKHTVTPREHGSEMDTMHKHMGGGGLCNCAPVYTCATHSLTPSRVSRRLD